MEMQGVAFGDGVDGEPNGSVTLYGQENSYIEISAQKSNIDTKFSTSIVIYVFPVGPAGPIVNYKKDGYGVQIWHIRGGENGKGLLLARFNRRDNLRYTAAIEESILDMNQWNYLAVTYNHLSGYITLFKNNELVTSKFMKKDEAIATQYDVRLGAIEIWNEYFNGRLSCLQIYNKALSKAEIENAKYNCRQG